MGSALLRGWVNNNINASFSVIEPNDIEAPTQITHFKTVSEAQEALANADMVILAVKPQMMVNICTELSAHISEQTCILSIAAGQSLQSFKTYFGAEQPVIRSMPNTPAAIGKGISVSIAGKNVNDGQKALANTLLSCAGHSEWVDDESLMDAVTAVSGSGPAYIFHLIEVLANSGEKLGLSKELANKLARQTVIGASALAENDADMAAETLRQNVTSPGGTTAAALEVLMNGELQALFDRALSEAQKRGKELNG